MKKHAWRLGIGVLFALMLSVVGVKAYYYYLDYFYMDGCNFNCGITGLWAYAQNETTYAAPDNSDGSATFIQVRLDGVGGTWCNGGSDMGGGWCGDSAHWFVPANWTSHAGVVSNQPPYGWYTATVISYVNQQVRDNYPIAKYFSDPNTDPQACADDGGYIDPNSGLCFYSPIIINTKGHPSYQLDSKVGVTFDLSGTGQPGQYSWPSNPDDAFLVYDADGDGQITSGKELFGNRTLAGASNGFIALAKLSQANFGYVDATHGGEFWKKLMLWTDRNHDGISQPDELQPVSDVLDAIGLGYTIENRRDGAGNLYRYKGWARLKDAPGKKPIEQVLDAGSREFAIYDVILGPPKK